MIFKKSIILFCITLSYSVTPLLGQFGGGGEAYPDLHTNQEALRNWRDMRFGMFIHWGPVALRGTEISWSRGREVPIKDYDSLYKEFNPVLFDPVEWVETARRAGMKYLIITAKHHDGFSIWDTKYSDYNIMNTPYGKDVLKLLAEECEKQGIKFGIYYSIADWYHPDYPGEYPYEGYREDIRTSKEFSKDEHQSMMQYITFMKNQLKELIDNYDPIVLWFDGEWEWPWTHKMGMDLYAYLRKLDPDLLINNRIDKGRQGMAGMTISEKFAGDFSTPEQEVGKYNTRESWEPAITIGQQWAWRPNDKLKSTQELKEILLNTVGGDGNLLLNVGPMLDGRIEQRQIDTLKSLGQWVDQNADAIYGTRGGPYLPTETMVSTRKDKKVFIHLLQHPGPQWKLPLPEETKVLEARFLNGSEQIGFRSLQGEVQLSLPDELPNPRGSIIELRLNKDAAELSTIERFRY